MMKKEVSTLETMLNDGTLNVLYPPEGEMNIILGEETMKFSIYRIPVNSGLLYYNAENARINTAVHQYQSEHPDAVLEPGAMGTENFNTVFDDFIRQQNETVHEKMKDSMKRFGQSTAGICMADGRILSGNCRFAALRDLQKNSEEPYFFKTGIIADADYSSSKKIKLLELLAQNSIHIYSDYDPFNRLCDIAQSVLIEKVCTQEEYLSTYLPFKNSNVLKEFACAELLVELCDFLDISTDRMYLLEKYNISAQLMECTTMLKQIPDSEENALIRAKIKEHMFSEIMIYREKNAVGRARHDKNLFKGLERSSLVQFLDSHHEAVVLPMKEIIQKLRNEINSLSTPEEFKALMDCNVSQADENRTSLKDAALDWATQKSAEKAELTTITSPIKQAQSSLGSLKKVDIQHFPLMSNQQKAQLSSNLSELQQLTQSLITALNESSEKDS